MNFLPDEYNEILNIFGDESREIVEKFNSNLLGLEKNPEDNDIIMALFQDVHSLKGAARMVGFYNIQNISHKIEDILSLIRAKKITVTENIITELYRVSDLLVYLIENSVKNKSDFYCDSIETHIKDLEQIIGRSSDYNEEKIDIPPSVTDDSGLENFLKQIPSINALILESIFVIDRYNEKEKETHISIIADNFTALCEIFSHTGFEELKEKIFKLKETLDKKLKNIESIDLQDINRYKESISDITNGINIIFSHLSVAQIPNNLEFEVQETQKPDETTSETSSDKIQLKEKLEYLSGNLSQIKFDPIYIENSQKHLLNLLNYDFNEDIIKIYKKIFDILELIKKLGIQAENDVVTILTQSINITKNIILNNELSETEDLSLLFQRLSIVEQMIDIAETKGASSIQSIDENAKHEPEFQKIQEFFKTFEIGTIKTLRVDTKKLDTLISQTGELIINGIKTQKHLSELDKFSSKLIEWNSLFKKTMNYIKYYDKKGANKFEYNETINKQIYNLLEENQNNVNEMILDVNELYKQINEDDIKLNHIILEIENIVKSIRVLPLATVFHMFPRMVRDIAANNNKEVELLISGSETTVDKKIIEEIKMPLIHILRNSIDHGIESPEERIKNNKPRVGRIHLSAKYSEDKIIIEVDDDGTGINLKKVKEKALQKGLLTQEEINSMSSEQLMNLIFWPGFSTGDTITEISGRGIGLDIVQTKIAQLNGKIKIYSLINQGAKVIIELPLSMSTVKSFIIGIEEHKFAIAMSAIKTVQWLSTEKIFVKDGYNAMIFENQTIPVIDLAQMMGIRRKREEYKKNKTIIILESENTRAAYIVDQLLGDQEIIHKKLSPPIFKLKNIAGITTLASGDLCLILNVSEILRSAVSINDSMPILNENYISTSANIIDPSKFKILLIDDSKTTLALLEKILLNAGYKVSAYSDPQKAMMKIKHENVNLIISDIEMPELNGKELISYVKNDEMLSSIPIIIISTIPVVKMKNEFKDLNINDFINKLNFNKQTFLNKIADILTK